MTPQEVTEELVGNLERTDGVCLARLNSDVHEPVVEQSIAKCQVVHAGARVATRVVRDSVTEIQDACNCGEQFDIARHEEDAPTVGGEVAVSREKADDIRYLWSPCAAACRPPRFECHAPASCEAPT
jgi:hypothetical protein